VANAVISNYCIRLMDDFFLGSLFRFAVADGHDPVDVIYACDLVRNRGPMVFLLLPAMLSEGCHKAT
jgi:hypothetical protein